MSNEPTLGKELRKRREEGFVVDLSTGCTVKVRPVAIDRLILAGQIPDYLTALAAKQLWGKITREELTDLELAKQYADLVNLIVPLAVASPRIVENPQADDEISIDDLDFRERTTIYTLAVGPVELLRRFRDRQTPNVAALLDNEDDQQTSE